jgi:exopolysaccharide production protein ExoQ
MGSIALALCLVFVAFFLVRDIRRRKSVSVAVWIPTALLLVFGSRPLSVWLVGGVQYVVTGNEAQRSPLDEGFIIMVLAGALIIGTSRKVKWSKLFAANTGIMLLYLFFAVSVLWSGDPLGSTKRLCKDFGLLFVISVIFSEKDPLEALQAVYYRCACVLFPLSVVFIRYFPSLGRAYGVAGDQMITGVTTQKNSLGEIVLVFGLFLLWDCLDPHPVGTTGKGAKFTWDRLILLVMGAYLLNVSQSKTALMCLSIGSVLILRNRRFASKAINRVVLLAAMSVPILLLMSQQFSSVISPLVEALGRNMTFTGRTDIWAQITSTTVNPLIGAGYWNFWGGPGGRAITRAMNTPVPNAHCGYLDIYLDGGFVGLFLLYVCLFSCGQRIIGNFQKNRYQSVRLAVLIAAILYNLSESIFLRLSPLWFTTLLVMVEFPLRNEATENSKSGSAVTITRVAAAEPNGEKNRERSVPVRSGLTYGLQ